MTLDQYVSILLLQISESENYQQVESIISKLSEPAKDIDFPIGITITELKKKIANLSPLTLNSTQWSCLRYALICLRSLSKTMQF